MVVDAISRLEYNLNQNLQADCNMMVPTRNHSKQQQCNWKTMTKYWVRLDTTTTTNSKYEYQEWINQVFAHHGKEDEICPLT